MFNGSFIRNNKSWRQPWFLLDSIRETDESSASSPPTLSPEVNDQLATFWTSSEDQKTQIPSLFEKMDGYFEESEEIRAPPNTSTSPTTHSNVQCICFNCWGPVTSGSSSSKTWKSLEQCGIPILPVFVGSPTDSLLMYGGAEGKPESLMSSLRMNTNHTDVSMDSTLPSQSSSGASNTSSGWRNVASFLESSTNKSTNDVNTQKVELEEENDLLQMKIQLQSEVIQKLIELSNVSEKLTKMKSR